MSEQTHGSRAAARHARREEARGVVVPDVPSDAALLAAVRDGDTGAYETVYRRHAGAATRLARVLSHDRAEADDLVSESFARLLAAVKAGGGPESAVRAYLLTTLRRVHIDRGRASSRVEPVEDVAELDRPEEQEDPAVRKLDRAYAARAFAGLPERWQAVLWHTEVEGDSPAKVAPLLGLSPNAVAAIAYRARERLRQLYLQQHLAAADGKECRWCTERLGAYVRDKLSERESVRVREHLDGCDSCRVVYLDLVEVNSSFRSLLAPVILGAAAVPYLAAAGKGVLFGLVPLAGGWWRKAVRNPTTAAVAAVVVLLALGLSAWALVGNIDQAPKAADVPNPPAATGQGGGGGGSGGAGPASSTSPASATMSPSPAAAHSTGPAQPGGQPGPQPAGAGPAAQNQPAAQTGPTRRPATTVPPMPTSRPTHPAPEPTTSRPQATQPEPEPTTSKPQPTHSQPTHSQPTTSAPEPTPTPTESSQPPPDDPPPICLGLPPLLKICIGL